MALCIVGFANAAAMPVSPNLTSHSFPISIGTHANTISKPSFHNKTMAIDTTLQNTTPEIDLHVDALNLPSDATDSNGMASPGDVAKPPMDIKFDIDRYSGDSQVCVCCNQKKLMKFCHPETGGLWQTHNCKLQMHHCAVNWNNGTWSSTCICSGETECNRMGKWLTGYAGKHCGKDQ